MPGRQGKEIPGTTQRTSSGIGASRNSWQRPRPHRFDANIAKRWADCELVRAGIALHYGREARRSGSRKLWPLPLSRQGKSSRMYMPHILCADLVGMNDCDIGIAGKAGSVERENSGEPM